MRVGISGTHGTGRRLLELVYGDPLDAWGDLPMLELTGPVDGRLGAVLAALDQVRAPDTPRG